MNKFKRGRWEEKREEGGRRGRKAERGRMEEERGEGEVEEEEWEGRFLYIFASGMRVTCDL